MFRYDEIGNIFQWWQCLVQVNLESYHIISLHVQFHQFATEINMPSTENNNPALVLVIKQKNGIASLLQRKLYNLQYNIM